MALLASAVAGGLVAASLAGRYGLAAGVAVVQVLLLVGLTRTAGVPAGRTVAGVALVAGLGTSAFIVTSTDGPFDIADLSAALVAIGAGFVAMVVVQLARRDGRERLTASLSFGVTALVLATATAGWLALGDDDLGTAVLLLALAGVAVGAAITIFPGPLVVWAVGSVIGSASVGVIMATYAPPVDDVDISVLAAAVMSGACGLAAVVGVGAARMMARDRLDGAQIAPSRIDHVLVSATLPLALAAPAAVGCAWALAEGLLA